MSDDTSKILALPAATSAPVVQDVEGTPEEDALDSGPGVFEELGRLPPGTIVTEDALARMLGRGCRESIRRAVGRCELPAPVRLLGKNVWTAKAIVQHVEERLAAVARCHARNRP